MPIPCTLILARVDYEVQGCVGVYMYVVEEIQAILSTSFMVADVRYVPPSGDGQLSSFVIKCCLRAYFGTLVIVLSLGYA